jgi:hypothetical protein
MANISKANGTMTLKGAWKPKAIKHLNTIARELWMTWTYGLELDEFEAYGVQFEKSSAFFGNGRWSFRNSLKYLGEWTADEAKENPGIEQAYNELLHEMHVNGLKIGISFTDEESGNLLLYSQSGVLTSDGKTLVYNVSSEEDHDFNWETYLREGDDPETFNMLVESLCVQRGIDNENSLVERWAMERTYPLSMSFDGLDDDTQAEFNELFLSMPTESELGIFLGFAGKADSLEKENLINAPSGMELVKYCTDTVAAYREQGYEPSDSGYEGFITKSLIDSYGIPAVS